MRADHARFWIAVLAAIAFAIGSAACVDSNKYGHAVFFGLGSQMFARSASAAAARIFNNE